MDTEIFEYGTMDREIRIPENNIIRLMVEGYTRDWEAGRDWGRWGGCWRIKLPTNEPSELGELKPFVKPSCVI